MEGRRRQDRAPLDFLASALNTREEDYHGLLTFVRAEPIFCGVGELNGGHNRQE